MNIKANLKKILAFSLLALKCSLIAIGRDLLHFLFVTLQDTHRNKLISSFLLKLIIFTFYIYANFIQLAHLEQLSYSADITKHFYFLTTALPFNQFKKAQNIFLKGIHKKYPIHCKSKMSCDHHFTLTLNTTLTNNGATLYRPWFHRQGFLN